MTVEDGRNGEPILNAPPLTVCFSLILAGFWGFLQVAPQGWTLAALDTLALFPPYFMALNSQPLSLDSVMTVGTVLTYTFVHLSFLHLLVNVGFLLAIGSMCERVLGRPRYVWLLLISAIAGGAVQLAADWGEAVVVYGASGAVSGCLGAMVRIALAGRLRAARRFAIAMLTVVVVTNLLMAVFGGAVFGVDTGVAWEAHLGGAAAGFLVGRPGRGRRTRVAEPG